MAARTNKRWIAAKKQQIKKQADRTKWAKRFTYPQRNLSIQDWKDLWAIWVKENPKGRTYHRFLKWRKVCYETRLRIDPDWYRLVKMPNWWLDFVEVPFSWWTRKKIIKSVTQKQ